MLSFLPLHLPLGQQASHSSEEVFLLRQSGLFGATGYAGGFLYATKSGRQVAAPTLLHYSVGKACHQVVHFLIAADIVRPVQNILPLGLAQVRIAVHSRGVGG